MPVIETIERIRVTTFAARAMPALLTSTPADPFLIDHDCLNPAGHETLSSCGDVVCFHCSKVFWS